MSFHVLYEYNVTIKTNYSAIAWLAFAIIQGVSFFVAIFYFKFIKPNSPILNRQVPSCIVYFALVLSFAIMCATIYAPFSYSDTKGKLLNVLHGKKEYYEGRQLVLGVVEGYVENFTHGQTLKKIPEQFEISHKKFSYAKNSFFTYNRFAKDGGIIWPGRYLKIHYVYLDPFWGKLILKIEEDPAKTKVNINDKR